MAVEQTLALIKPDAVSKNYHGEIIDAITKSPLDISAIKKVRFSQDDAGVFYAVHRKKQFFDDLVSFMSSGPLYALVLEGESAVEEWRNMIGDTNCENAAEGTLRKKYATSIGRNAVHGSDSPENARLEIGMFFSYMEICK
ncbi:MAG: nucleoside-diphosphate kinase [Fibrobacterota bacterium]